LNYCEEIVEILRPLFKACGWSDVCTNPFKFEDNYFHMPLSDRTLYADVCKDGIEFQISNVSDVVSISYGDPEFLKKIAEHLEKCQ